EGGRVAIVEVAQLPRVHVDLDLPARALGRVVAPLDLVARVGAARGAEHGGSGVPAAAPDLVTQHAAGDAADDRATAPRRSWSVALVHRFHGAAGVALRESAGGGEQAAAHEDD